MAAARKAFAEQGLNASLEGVAREAGAAIGMLYRHFPNRLDLVEELFAAKFPELLGAAERPQPWTTPGRGFEERFCELQACDSAFDYVARCGCPSTPWAG
ncbi:helix-turn-helix domain-containing protein [Streptomyces sp. NPDC056683]|uniref:helix-turn-helix domain-containing protein n=1 Tax=Streptomyces sp. NPDC056683 TaxID=3345910 RepID=UPI00367CCC64